MTELDNMLPFSCGNYSFPFHIASSSSRKYVSRLIPAVRMLVSMWVTATILGLVLMTTGRLAPGFVITMWSPLVR